MTALFDLHQRRWKARMLPVFLGGRPKPGVPPPRAESFQRAGGCAPPDPVGTADYSCSSEIRNLRASLPRSLPGRMHCALMRSLGPREERR